MLSTRSAPVSFGFSFAGAATKVTAVVTSPRRSSVGLAGLGVLAGLIGGWLAGLLRAPRARAPR